MPTSYEIVQALQERMRLYREVGPRGDLYLAAHHDDVLMWAEDNLTKSEQDKMLRLAGV